VLRAAEETETVQQNIHDLLELDEGDTGYQLLTGRISCSDFFYLFTSISTSICFLSLLFSLSLLSFASLICSNCSLFQFLGWGETKSIDILSSSGPKDSRRQALVK
jgi:hypothetical protein